MKLFVRIGALSYLLIGLAHVIAGSLLPELLAYYGRDYHEGGQLVSLQFAGFLIGVLTGPWFTRKWDRKGALLLSVGCLTAAELLFATVPPWEVVLLIAPFAGFGFGMIETLIGALVIRVMEGDQKAVVMTRLEVFFGVGALVMPLLASLFIRIEWWRGAFLTLGLLSLIVFVLWALMPIQSSKSAQAGQQHGNVTAAEGRSRGLRSSYSYIVLGVFVAIFLLYVGIEMSIANFLPVILLERFGTPSDVGALGVTCFWAAMSVGRFVAAAIAQRLGHARYLILGCTAGAILLACFAVVSQTWSAFVMIALLGFVLSGFFAIALVYANGFFPGAEERTTSFLIASGGVGGALIPLWTGWSLDLFAVIPTLGMLVSLLVLMLVLVVFSSKLAISVKSGVR
jgi:FHS family glucose/mannose:H+ symporter-like MFS transporter